MIGLRKLWSGAGRLILALVVLSFSSSVFAKDLPIAWDSNVEPDLAGYHVYFGPEGQPLARMTVPEAQAVLPDLVPGRTYAIYVTAFNTLGIESAPSETILYTVPADALEVSSIQKSAAGSSLHISGVGFPGKDYRIEAASDLRVPMWKSIASVTADANGRVEVVDGADGPARFYRIVEAGYNSGGGGISPLH